MFHNINKLQSNLNNYDRCDCMRLYNYFGDAHFLTFFKTMKLCNQTTKTTNEIP